MSNALPPAVFRNARYEQRLDVAEMRLAQFMGIVSELCVRVGQQQEVISYVLKEWNTVAQELESRETELMGERAPTVRRAH